jgi:hypothetical protein
LQPEDVGYVVFNDAAYAAALDKIKLALVQAGKTPDPKEHPTVHKVKLSHGQVLEAFVVEAKIFDIISYSHPSKTFKAR